MRFIVALAALALIVVGCDRSPPAPAAADRSPPPPAPSATPAAAPKPHAGADGLQRAGDLDVFEVVTGGARTDERLPLIIAVHGLGDDPQSFALLAAGFNARARIALPRGPERWGDGFSWFSFRPDMTEAELATGLKKAVERLARAIDDFARNHPTQGRPVVTGFSQGGMLSFAIAAQRPTLVRAAYPVGGLLPRQLWPTEKTQQPPPVIALHGETDNVVPIGPARRTVQALVTHGYDARLEAFPGVGHSVPPDMRRRLFTLLEGAVRDASRNPGAAR